VTAVVTDLGVLEPDPETKELVLTRTHPGATADEARAATGWELRVAEPLETTEPPSELELAVLRSLKHAGEEERG
jgi:acyl CoA:acetate/3-ketoacid CoA transferase beta subunit